MIKNIKRFYSRSNTSIKIHDVYQITFYIYICNIIFYCLSMCILKRTNIIRLGNYNYSNRLNIILFHKSGTAAHIIWKHSPVRYPYDYPTACGMWVGSIGHSSIGKTHRMRKRRTRSNVSALNDWTSSRIVASGDRREWGGG